MTVQFQPLVVQPVTFSLTAGTNIPAPLDSPPRTPTSHSAKAGLAPLVEETSNEENTAPKSANGDTRGLPMSPLSAGSGGSDSAKKRPTGVRKFLSLRSLRGDRHGGNGSHRFENGPLSPTGSGRPGSPYTTDTVLSAESNRNGSLQRKRSAGWFGSAGGRRKSSMFVGRVDERIVPPMPTTGAVDGAEETESARKKRMGPPPPTIPEWSSLGTELDGGSLGADDMFKDIK